MLLGLTSVLALPASNYTPGVWYGPDGEELPIHYTGDLPSALRKRANTPINCDPGLPDWTYRFRDSSCERQTSPQNWVCNGLIQQQLYNIQNYQTRGVCAPNQICVDGLDGGRTTYCADQLGFIQITQTLLKKMAQQGLQYGYTGPTGGSYAVEAVFTDENDATKPIELDNIDVTAAKNQLVLGKYTQQITGENECTQCSSLGFQPIPDQSTIFQFKGTFPSSVTGARLYFWQSNAT